jgi:glycosyltransferase involved in cell wall biosynthesis
MPRVSICIPCYNQTQYLEKVLASIVVQSYKDYEVIIGDDSTTSEVKHLVEDFNSKGLKACYYHNMPALGSPGNWNFLLSKAKGELIKFMHHDDWFTSPSALEKMVKALEEHKADFVFCGATMQYENYGFSRYYFPNVAEYNAFIIDPTLLLLTNHISTPSNTLFVKDITMDFDLQLKWLVDVDFYIRYLLKHPNIIGLDESLVHVTGFAEHNISNDCFNNHELLLREHFMLYQRFKKISKQSEMLEQGLVTLIHQTRTHSLGLIRNTGYREGIPLSVYAAIAKEMMRYYPKALKFKLNQWFRR